MASPAGQDTTVSDLENIAGQLIWAGSNLTQPSAACSASADRVLDIADTIEGLGLLLLQTGRQLPNIECCNSAILQRSISIWKRHSERIAHSTSSLKNLTTKRNDDAYTFITPDIAQLCHSLERSYKRMGLAYQLFQSSRTNVRSKQVAYNELYISGQARVHAGDVYHNISGAPTDRTLTTKSRPLAESNSSASPALVGPGLRLYPPVRVEHCSGPHIHEGRSWRYKAKVKPLFLSWIWQVSLQRAAAGWNATFRTYNLISGDSLIFEFAWDHDVARMCKMTRLGMASLYDQSEYGTVAEITMTGFLIDHWRSMVSGMARGFVFSNWEDIDRDLINVEFDFESSDWEPMLHMCFAEPSFRDEIYRELRQYILEGPGDESIEELEKVLDHLARPGAAPFVARPIDTPTCRTRLESAWWKADYSDGRFSLSQLMETLCCAEISQELASTSTRRGYTLMHMVAILMDSDEDWSGLVAFVRQLYRAGADLHHLAELYSGKLSRFDGYLLMRPATPMLFWATAKSGSLEAWARLLQEADVDLVSYGELELQEWEIFDVEGWRDGNFEHWYKFDYGPAPTDWTLYVESYIMIDLYEKQHPTTIPGSWPRIADTYIPTLICWLPDEIDKNEGVWKLVESTSLETVWEDDPQFTPDQDIEAAKAQDDHGELGLQELGISRLGRFCLRRSKSQPEFRAMHAHEEDSTQACFISGKIQTHRCYLGPRPRIVFSPSWRPRPSRYCVEKFHNTTYIDNGIDAARESFRREAERMKAERYVDEEYARRFPNDPLPNDLF